MKSQSKQEAFTWLIQMSGDSFWFHYFVVALPKGEMQIMNTNERL